MVLPQATELNLVGSHADPAQRTEEQIAQIAVLRRALGQVQQHQAQVKEDMIYARAEVRNLHIT